MFTTRLILGLLAATTAVLCHEGDVFTVQYDTENFSSSVVKKNHFVMFYAPWCGHCQRLAPTWEQLAEVHNKNEEKSIVRIAKVDCTTDNAICLEQDITGYPTLKFFKVGETEGIKYKGMRDLPSLHSFINEHTRTGDEEQETNEVEEGARVVEYTDDNFEAGIASGKHFVKFYAPWCGHCQKLAPVWESLPESLDDDSDTTIGKIDCTTSRDTCSKFEIKGYPTLLWIVDGQKVEKYKGARTIEEFKDFIKKMSGSAEKVVDKEKQEETQSKVIELTTENFHKIEDSLFAIVKFYAPWCGHCKRLSPTWEDLGKAYADDEQVAVVKVDCASDENKDLCSEQDIEGFPTIILYKKGKRVEEYDGARDLDSLKGFVSKFRTEHDEL